MSVSASTIRCPVCVDSATSRWGSRGGPRHLRVWRVRADLLRPLELHGPRLPRLLPLHGNLERDRHRVRGRGAATADRPTAPTPRLHDPRPPPARHRGGARILLPHRPRRGLGRRGSGDLGAGRGDRPGPARRELHRSRGGARGQRGRRLLPPRGRARGGSARPSPGASASAQARRRARRPRSPPGALELCPAKSAPPPAGHAVRPLPAGPRAGLHRLIAGASGKASGLRHALRGDHRQVERLFRSLLPPPSHPPVGRSGYTEGSGGRPLRTLARRGARGRFRRTGDSSRCSRESIPSSWSASTHCSAKWKWTSRGRGWKKPPSSASHKLR